MKRFIYDPFYKNDEIQTKSIATKSTPILHPDEKDTKSVFGKIPNRDDEKQINTNSEKNISAKKYVETPNKVKQQPDILVVQKQVKKERLDGQTPTLAIIIDDVSTKTDVAKIQDVGFPITMAFMPPTERHKNSAIIAQNSGVHIVHLPLEASTRKAEESNTLYVGDSLEKIDERIKQIRKWYPNAKYINNHTGSKFTADEDSMDKLLQTVKKYDFIFIDSRTTPKTVGQKYTQKYGFRYIGRDVFLDNVLTRESISGQIKEAVKIAKKTGNAVVIGHPHDITLKTLKDSKSLFDDINIVLIDKI